MFRILGKTESCRQSERTLFFKKSYRTFIAYYRLKSHYAALELDSTATPQQIKAAYYRLSLKYHPDKNKGSMESVEKFREISEAYEVLGNADKKRSYDQDGRHQWSETTNWRQHSYTPRSYRYPYRSPPRTGRDQYYNYDEHYRQHYEEYERQQRVDYEHLRRRWDADFRRRNPYRDNPYRDAPDSSKKTQFPEINWKSLFLRNKFFIYFMTLWASFFLITFMDDFQNFNKDDNIYKAQRNNRHSGQTKLYYKTKRDNDEN